MEGMDKREREQRGSREKNLLEINWEHSVTEIFCGYVGVPKCFLLKEYYVCPFVFQFTHCPISPPPSSLSLSVLSFSVASLLSFVRLLRTSQINCIYVPVFLEVPVVLISEF